MAINNKKAFTLIEVLVAMLLFGIIITFSVKAYSFIVTNHKINEIRYLALNKIDSEMNRLVFAYENFNETEFTFSIIDTVAENGTSWDDSFNVPYSVGNSIVPMKIYNQNPLTNDFGLRVEGSWIGRTNVLRNVIELVDNTTANTVESGDIIGLMAWKIEHNTTNPKFVHLSLSITYPYFNESKKNNVHGELETIIIPIDGLPIETINIKSSTRIKN